jgi:hypothetical protein
MPMSPGEIHLARFPMGGRGGMKVRPVRHLGVLSTPAMQQVETKLRALLNL